MAKKDKILYKYFFINRYCILFKYIFVCLYFVIPHFIFAQTFQLNIGLGSSLGFEFANNSTNTISTGLHETEPYFYHNKNKYYDVPIDTFITLDIKYLETSIGVWWGGRSIITETEGTWTLGYPGNTRNWRNGGLIGGWMWSSYLKTPPLGRMLWFPIIGIESRNLLGLSPGDEADQSILVDNSNKWNNFWYKFGIGLDREFIGNLFFRSEYLLGFRGNNQYENELTKIENSGVNGVPFSISIKIMFYYRIK